MGVIMAYTLPTFNLTLNGWQYATYVGNFPSIIPAADYTSTCNLALGKRIATADQGVDMWLLLPAFTDIRGEINEALNSSHGDIVEVPAGSGRYYGVSYVDDAGKGFANEHRIARLTIISPFKVLLPAWPLPYP
jgi:hypothetical protein